MILQRTVKVQESKTNVTINIPAEHRSALGISGGDTLLIMTDTDKQEIILRKVDEESAKFYNA